MQIDFDKLLPLYHQIQPRQPRGSPENKLRIGQIARFQAEARRQGLAIRDAFKACREQWEKLRRDRR